MSFREVIGHRKLVALLARAVHHGSLPPSLILAGPSGIGKRLLAVATAQALNCPAAERQPPPPEPRTSNVERRTSNAERRTANVERRTANVDRRTSNEEVLMDACGTCATCTRIVRGVYPDVLIVEPGDSGAIKVDQVRDLIDRAAYRPFEGRRRVVIIDEADALVSAAQNALLKTLEEPPSLSVFMLITARPDALLPTVRSRCPRLRFRPLGPEDVAAALVQRGRTLAEARLIAATADGSVGRALEASAGDLGEARDIALRVLSRAAATDDPRRRIEGAKDLLPKPGGDLGAGREQVATGLRAMASLIRDVSLLSTSADSRALANPDVQPAIEGLSAYQGERGIRAFTAVDRALMALDRNAGVKVVADWLVLQL
jgi:DNA polymerase-3 subunit delta'